jgi:hypothetical protein
VAISRAQGVAILVCSPALLRVRCHTPAQMRLANALCRYVEVATGGLDAVSATSTSDRSEAHEDQPAGGQATVDPASPTSREVLTLGL